ncbi:aminopeptidase [Marinicrinis lubricantis]|uniref:Aminopeptidase n=1 Tax=Marinicrinis lubricantis TaxID=2086470 RepID=A0ABW1IJG0_9BACL
MKRISELQLDRYAELAVRVGANVQKGQKLVLQAPVTAASFAARITKKAYEAGAMVVMNDWIDSDEIIRSKFLLAPDEAFEWYPMWRAKGMEELAEEGAAVLQIYIPNPDLYEGVDPARVAAANKVKQQALRNYRTKMMNDDISWSLISIPSPEWAKRLFPDLSEDEAMEEMWALVLKMARADGENPIEDWKAHLKVLAERRELLNNKRYKKLHYRSQITDLTIELPEDHLWLSAQSENGQGTSFVPNIPTEEVFTLPLKTGVNGVVGSTKPLNYRGSLIDDFRLTFKDGKIVEFSAAKGEEALKNMLATDEGASYLGEVALVPYDSPISNTNKIFYNTLYDENASCHLAIGAAYPTTLKGGRKMSREELDKHGVNDSLIHEDFMMGSADLSIDGELADGTKEAVFRNGNWAF